MPGAIMRLLMVIGVLLCSMHVAEPASAHSTSSETAFHLTADDSERDRQEPASVPVHSGHHHCPVAPDLRATADDAGLAFAHAPLFAGAVTQLASRVLPPLLDPPLLTI